LFGMNVIENGSPEHEKSFLLKRHGRGRHRWYKGVESEDPDRLDEWCGAKISIVTNKAALGLSLNRLHESIFMSEYQGIRPRDLQYAEENSAAVTG